MDDVAQSLPFSSSVSSVSGSTMSQPVQAGPLIIMSTASLGVHNRNSGRLMLGKSGTLRVALLTLNILVLNPQLPVYMSDRRLVCPPPLQPPGFC